MFVAQTAEISHGEDQADLDYEDVGRGGRGGEFGPMAKVKLRAHPGAISDLLKRKVMTQMDAATQTKVDRKTLTKIDRGEEVKLETLQKVAMKLNVPLTFFDPPHSPPAESNDVREPWPWERSLTLHELDAQLLTELLESASRIQWQLNLQSVDEQAGGFLEEFEKIVQQLHKDLTTKPFGLGDDERHSLHHQLNRLKKRKELVSRMDQLADHGLTLTGAEYLFWEQSESSSPTFEEYTSSRVVLLSIESHGVQSRRLLVDEGSTPPKFAPNASTTVYVDGMRLRTKDNKETNKDPFDENGIPF